MRKRKYERIPSTILSDLYTPDSAVSKGRGCVVDLSLGGLAIETETKFSENTEMVLLINLPVRVSGRITRSQSVGNLYRYGIKFTKLGFMDKLRLKRHIKSWVKYHRKEI